VAKQRLLPGPVGVATDDRDAYHPDVAVFREPPPDEEDGTRTPLVVFVVSSRTRRRAPTVA
jgi:hypothetical protein